MCSDLVEKEKVDGLTPLLDLMMDLGLIFNEEHPTGFIKIMNTYRSVGEDLLSINHENVQERVDDILRDVSWLGEKLLFSMDRLEHRPLMDVGHRESRLGSLLNCLYGIGHKLSSDEGKDKYVRTYLDSLYVIARELLRLMSRQGELDDREQNRYEEQFFFLMHDHQTLFEVATRANNTHNTSIIILKIKDFVKLAAEHNQKKMMDDTIESIFRIGAIAAPRQKELGKLEFSISTKTYTDAVIECMSSGDVDPEVLDREAHEILIKCIHEPEHRKAVNDYLETVCNTFASNFGKKT